MSLKLFRSTGYSSILTAGETRVATHPGWLILLTSLWVGFASNGALWQQLSAPAPGGMSRIMTAGAFTAGAAGAVLSGLGWRKTLKPAAIVVLLLAALAASNSWPPQMLPWGKPGFSMFMPAGSGLLRWQLWATLAVLAVLPAVCVCKVHVRRLPGDQQLRVNMAGVALSGAVLAASGLSGGLS